MATTTSSSGKLVRVLYRGLLRAAARLDAGATPARATLDAHFAPILGAAGTPLPAGAPTLRDVVRHQFKSPPHTSAKLDAGLRALAIANKLAAGAAGAPRGADERSVTATAGSSGADTRQAQAAPAPKPGQPLALGQVFRHRVFGYRAVVIGADAECSASAQWIKATGADLLPRGTRQPFYRCLVDIRDRPAAQVSYVAADNVELLPASDDAEDVQRRLVLHPLLTRYFSAYRTDAGSYVPGARLMTLEAAEDSDGEGALPEPAAAAARRGGSSSNGVPRVSSVAA